VHATIVGRSYAEALFEIGEKHDAHDDIAQGLNLITTLLDADPRIRTFLETPKVDVSRKQQVLRETLGGQVAPLFLNFLLVVLRQRRQRLLQDIALAYRDMLDRKLGRVQVAVTVAHEPDEELEQTLRAQLSRIVGQDVVPRIRVEPGILGGVIIRYGDRIIDASVRRRLIGLRRNMAEAIAPAGR
jgi:F-type H+-transporting ATPase subunit delta